jgi:hypothetical protein
MLKPAEVEKGAVYEKRYNSSGFETFLSSNLDFKRSDQIFRLWLHAISPDTWIGICINAGKEQFIVRSSFYWN